MPAPTRGVHLPRRSVGGWASPQGRRHGSNLIDQAGLGTPAHPSRPSRPRGEAWCGCGPHGRPQPPRGGKKRRERLEIASRGCMTSHGGALAPPGVVPGGAVEAVGTASLGLDGAPGGRRLRSEGRRRRPIPSPLRPATGPKGEGRLGWRRGRVRLALVVRVPPRGGAVVPSSRPPWPRPSTVTVLRPFGAPRASRGEGHAGVETGRRDPVGGRGP